MKESIEYYFFKFFLTLIIAGAIIITSFDFINKTPFLVDVGVTSLFVVSYLLLLFGSLRTAVLFFTSTIFTLMYYRCYALDGFYSGNRMLIFITLGFIYSLLLKSPSRWVMHIATLAGLIILFIWQFLHPEFFDGKGGPGIIGEGLPYFVIYASIGLSTMLLKDKYDVQKEELLARQNELNAINNNLEALVSERSKKIVLKNEQLLKYAFTNAHNVRGPLARILGLIILAKLEKSPDYPFLFDKVKEEAEIIDKILKEINEELDQQID